MFSLFTEHIPSKNIGKIFENYNKQKEKNCLENSNIYFNFVLKVSKYVFRLQTSTIFF